VSSATRNSQSSGICTFMNSSSRDVTESRDNSHFPEESLFLFDN
jgi:hypothetical protein